MNSLRTGQTGVREKNDRRGDSTGANESDHDSNDEYASDGIVSDREDDPNDVILSFTTADEEDTDERPVTRSGRAITRRCEIIFSFF